MSCINLTLPDNTAENETLPSTVENLVRQFFGTLVKTDDGAGNVTWELPCDLEAGIPGHPRVSGEGLACYFARILTDAVVGLNGKDAYAVSTASFVQPAVGDPVDVGVSTAEPFAVGQYVWLSTGGFYTISAISGLTLTLMNSYGAPHNVSAGSTIATGVKVLPSGVPETAGPQGAQGDVGPQGEQGDVGPQGEQGEQGETGPAGPPGSEPDQFWNFSAAGTHEWPCPTGVTSVRVKVYGAGGGGGGGASTANGGGNGFGGGGGEYAVGTVTVTPGTTYYCDVGAGGTGGTGGDGTADGSDGGVSKFRDGFTTFLEGKGGSGGGNPISGSVGPGGTGGSGTASLRFAGFPGVAERGGKCGREGAGGLGGAAGETPGGGGGAGIGDGGVGGDPGKLGAVGRVVIEVA